MEMSNWLNQIRKHGGMENVAEFIFDSGKLYWIRRDKPVEEQVEYDEENDCWVFYKESQPFEINKKTPQYYTENNENLQAIVFVNKEEDKKYFRVDI